MADIDSAALDRLASSSGAAADAAANLAAAGQSAATSTQAASGAIGMLANILNGAIENVGEYGGSIALLALRTTALTSSVYGTDKAFSSLVPVIEKMGEGLTSFGTLAKFMGVAGGAAAKAIAGTTFVFNKLSGVLRFQLESAQKVADVFVALNQNGASFGYSIQEMQMRATRAGVPLQTLAKIVQDNIEPLSSLGMGVQDASLNVTSLARDIIDNAASVRGAGRNYNAAVTASYGNMENLSAGIANYLQLQTMLGENVRSSTVMERIKTGEVQEYLLRQKELTAITGKNAAQLKKEEEERRKNYLYIQALNQMSPVQRKNTEEQMAMLKMISPALHDAAMEVVSFGDVMTPTGLQFQALNSEAVQFARQGLAMTNADRETFRRNLGNLSRQVAPTIRSFYQSQQDVIQSGMIGQNKLLMDIGATGVGFERFNSMLENSPDVFAQMEADRLKAAQEAMDPATQSFVDATRLLISNQVEIDQQITQNMQKMTGLVQALNYIQTTLIRLQGRISDAILTGFEQSRDNPAAAIGNALATVGQAMLDIVRNPSEFRERPAVSEQEEDRRWAELQRRNRAALEIVRGRQPAGPLPSVTPTPPPTPAAPEQNQTPSTSPGTPNTPPSEPPAPNPFNQGASLPATTATNNMAELRRTFSDMLVALNSNNNISSEQQQVLNDILRVQQNILDAVA